MTNPFTVTPLSPSRWCCTAAGARNYATPPPVLCAITGSASLSSQVLRLTWHRPALRYDHNNVHEIIHRGGFRFGCHQGNGWAFCLEPQPAGSVLEILLWGRRLVVNTHPGASKRGGGDDWTWRRAFLLNLSNISLIAAVLASARCTTFYHLLHFQTRCGSRRDVLHEGWDKYANVNCCLSWHRVHLNTSAQVGIHVTLGLKLLGFSTWRRLDSDKNKSSLSWIIKN